MRSPVLLAALLFSLAACAASEPVDFARDIQPILEQRCAECHGEKKQKSGVRVDSRSALLKPADSGRPAIVPGKSAESLLLERVTTSNDDDVMPPKGERLTARQIELLKAWVDQGATWPGGEVAEKKHWAYERPVRPPVPNLAKNSDRVRNPVDAFVLARLEQEQLTPGAPADRATLLRRASLDVIGLPPTIEELDAFLADKSSNAFEKAVDRLLASPHYGERWARPWLDGARYADTQGYEKDDRRSMWPYRDWVIKALNADMPFDQFTIEQLAGDMLPDATQDQKVATGFHRNTMTNTEGGTDDEEFRYEAVIDRVNTTWAVWMGSTMNCAQCHNHKYDPFTMKEYYQFMAFLNNTADSDKNDEQPTMKVYLPGQEENLAKLRATAAEKEKQFRSKADSAEIAAAREKWERDTVYAITNWQVLDPVTFLSAGGATLAETASKSIEASGVNPPNDTYTVTALIGPGRVTGVRLEILESGEKKALGRHKDSFFVLKKFTGAVGRRALSFGGVTADYSQKDYSVTNLLAGTGNGWAVDAGNEKNRVRRSAYFKLTQPLDLTNAEPATFILLHSDKFPEANVARFRLYATSGEQVGPPAQLPAEVQVALLSTAEKRTGKQKQAIRDHFESSAPELRVEREARLASRKAEQDFFNSIPITAVMRELEKPRTTYRHLRGAYLTKGEEVKPGTPEIMHSFPTNEPPNRLGVARWIVSTNNPLTARVAVNRMWEQLFGRGLVETVEEFGTQGEPPSHPELLDWLACELMHPTQAPAQPWSLKALLKTIVMSRTYQQSSAVSSELLARDPYNRLMARGPRVRLEGEMIRDQALTVSGLLSRKIGGPSVMPPQPEGVWQVVYSSDKWQTSKGEDRYRRGLYTFWRRTSPHPMLVSFDAPSREFCVLKRSRSNTPLQSLNLLNDPVFIECAQVLARKVAARSELSVEERARLLFRTCVAREATGPELNRLVALYQQQLENYTGDNNAAQDMATSEAGKLPSGVNAADAAAWTVVANVIMNLDEMITKG